MSRWVRILVITLAFWAVWIGFAGLAMVVHGDCGFGTTDAETAACVHEKGWVGIAALAIGAIVYGIAIRVILKRSRNRDP